MYQQRKTVLEIKNVFQEMLKGTPLEKVAKQIYTFFKRNQKIDFLINEEDNNLTIKILNQILTKKSNCIDVGCNTGDFLIPILQLSPSGHHYAFEPIPRLANRLRKKFPTADVREIALSDCEGEAAFWYVVDSPALSSLNKDIWNRHIPDALTESITVKTQKMDDILPPNFKIDFIKVDVEGAEYQVFKGGMHILKNHKPYIIFEHGLDDTGEGHDGRIYDLIVNECGLQIFELKNWLEGLPALTKNQFIQSHAWNFFAAP